MHAYYAGSGFGVPAEMKRKITEAELIDKHHWLPHEIAQIPYKQLQTYLIIENQKQAVSQNRANIEKAKSQHGQTSSRGQMKRFYQEV